MRAFKAAILLLALLSVLQGSVRAKQDDLQQQVHRLLGGSPHLRRHESGLVLPAHDDATNWLHDLYKTGLHINATADAEAVAAQQSWRSKLPASIGGAPRQVCGLPAAELKAPRRNLIITPVGDAWTAERWLNQPEMASFDIIAIYHGDKENYTCPLCTAVHRIKGPKWRLYLDLTSNDELWPPIAASYDRLLLPDDDIIMDTCSINKVFQIMKEYDLLLAQPSVCEVNGSGTWRPELHQRVQYLLRFTTFVEVMAPGFRMDFFNAVVRRTFSKYWTYVGWGLDSVWPALLHYPQDRIGVVDAVCMTHIPSEGGLGASLKPNSIYRPGLSPYSPKQEEMIVFSAFNYTASTVRYFKEPFMSSRVVGAVPNPEVFAALQHSLGLTAPPNPTSGDMETLGWPSLVSVAIAAVAACATVVVCGQVMAGRQHGRQGRAHAAQMASPRGNGMADHGLALVMPLEGEVSKTA